MGNHQPKGSPNQIHSEAREQFRNNNYQNALKLFQQALKSFNKTNGYYNKRVANEMHWIGDTHLQLNNHEKALEHYNKTLEIYKKINQEQSIQYARTLNNMGQANFKKGNYDKALEIYAESFKISQKYSIKNYDESISTAINMSFAYQSKGDNRRALECIQHAYEMYFYRFGAYHDLTKQAQQRLNIIKNKIIKEQQQAQKKRKQQNSPNQTKKSNKKPLFNQRISSGTSKESTNSSNIQMEVINKSYAISNFKNAMFGHQLEAVNNLQINPTLSSRLSHSSDRFDADSQGFILVIILLVVIGLVRIYYRWIIKGKNKELKKQKLRVDQFEALKRQLTTMNMKYHQLSISNDASIQMIHKLKEENQQINRKNKQLKLMNQDGEVIRKQNQMLKKEITKLKKLNIDFFQTIDKKQKLLKFYKENPNRKDFESRIKSEEINQKIQEWNKKTQQLMKLELNSINTQTRNTFKISQEQISRVRIEITSIKQRHKQQMLNLKQSTKNQIRVIMESFKKLYQYIQNHIKKEKQINEIGLIVKNDQKKQQLAKLIESLQLVVQNTKKQFTKQTKVLLQF